MQTDRPFNLRAGLLELQGMKETDTRLAIASDANHQWADSGAISASQTRGTYIRRALPGCATRNTAAGGAGLELLQKRIGMKYLHFIAGKLYAIDGKECDLIARERGQAWFSALLMHTKGYDSLSTYGNYPDQWLTGIEHAVRPFGYELAKSARMAIGKELLGRESGE